MGTWLRSRSRSVASGVVTERMVVGRRTENPCSAPGCPGADRVECDYVDRRGTPCPTAWCPEHVVTAGRGHFCRRHARLTHALAPAEFRGTIEPPDLGNRAPSLVAFLSEELGPRVRELLMEMARPELGERIADDPLHLVMTGARTRRWAQGWKLYESAGPLLRVDVEVDEESDPECALRLNGRVILRCVPPWIAARRGDPRAVPADPPGPGAVPAGHTATGGGSRESFCARLVETHLRPALVAEERWVRRWALSGPLRTGPA